MNGMSGTPSFDERNERDTLSFYERNERNTLSFVEQDTLSFRAE
jgi:hypothetical protein